MLINTVLGCHALPVLVDFTTRRVELGPSWIGLEGQLVRMGWYILPRESALTRDGAMQLGVAPTTRDAGISVLKPRPTQLRVLVVNNQVEVWNPLGKSDAGNNARDASPNDDDFDRASLVD
jgi:hypothetical protein